MAKKRPYENYRYKHYDSWLLNYAWIEEKIKRRKLEIETTHSNDINVGGGRSNRISKPVEELVLRWSDDTRLNSLEHFKEVAEYLYNLLDDDLKFIFRVRYASKEPKTAEEIATILGKKEKLIMPKIDRILELFADLMGD